MSSNVSASHVSPVVLASDEVVPTAHPSAAHTSRGAIHITTDTFHRLTTFVAICILKDWENSLTAGCIRVGAGLVSTVTPITSSAGVSGGDSECVGPCRAVSTAVATPVAIESTRRTLTKEIIFSETKIVIAKETPLVSPCND